MHGAFSYPYFHQGLNKTHTERDVRDQQAFESLCDHVKMSSLKCKKDNW